MRKIFKHAKFTAVFTDKDGYFSLTGECEGSSGAVGHKIAEIDSDFRPLEKMHLSDCKTGAPMHAWANAEYWAKELDYKKLENCLRCTDIEVKVFCDLLSDINVNSRIGELARRAAISNMSAFKTRLENQWKGEAKEAYEIADEIPSNLTKGFVNPYNEDGNYISQDYEDFLNDLSEPEKAIAIAMEEDIDLLDVEENGEYYRAAGREYRVFTDDEADIAWDESLESYIDDCLEIPESLERYFDREKWKEDAKVDGRGHSLSTYDGHERTQIVNGTTYFLYKC
jgi:hypothetical protein